MALVFLQRQYIFCLSVNDLFGNGGLTAHRIDGHNASGNCQGFQEL
jgi:hypothetical protein